MITLELNSVEPSSIISFVVVLICCFLILSMIMIMLVETQASIISSRMTINVIAKQCQ